jgi:Flp pilus assembly pilin Flp
MLGPFTINPAAACAEQGATGQPAPADPRPRRSKRRGVTAMEYCVMASFILAAVVMAVQHIGALIAPSFRKASTGVQSNPSSSSSSGSTAPHRKPKKGG